MLLEVLIALTAGITVGFALGLTGSGGSLFAIPLLIYIVGLDMASAVPISLFVVGITALIGAFSAYKKQLLLLRPTIIFGVAGILSAPVGLKLGSITPENYRMLGFATLAMIMAARIGWQSFNEKSSKIVRADLVMEGQSGICRYSPDGKIGFTIPCAIALVAAGAITGIMSGFFGVGGGFLIVPALMFVVRMNMPYAVGSSLAIIAMIGISGGALNGLPILIENNAALGFGAGSLLGMLLGRVLAGKLAGPLLQQIFTVALFSISIIMLFQYIGREHAF